MKGNEQKEYKDVHSVELIALGKKAYLDILEATHKETGEIKQSLHIRMKSVGCDSIEHAVHQCKDWSDPKRIRAVRNVYLKMLHGEEQEFDLTKGGLKTCFENCRDFTVRSRDKFARNLKFPKQEILMYPKEEILTFDTKPLQTLETMGYARVEAAPFFEASKRARRKRPCLDFQPTLDDFITELVTPDPRIISKLEDLRKTLRACRYNSF